jgi:EAL domain-containing protein (putative c-di-GMP-specific phosphodiesterase class I)
MTSSMAGKRYGVPHAIYSALLIGPLMPLNVELQVQQALINWVIRLGVYIIISFSIGYFSDFKSKLERHIQHLVTIDPLTGLGNLAALKYESIVSKNAHYIALKVSNYESLIHYFGVSFSDNMIREFSEKLIASLESNKYSKVFRIIGLDYVVMTTAEEESKIIDALGQINDQVIEVENIPIKLELFMGQSNAVNQTSNIESIRMATVSAKIAELTNNSIHYFEPTVDGEYEKIRHIASTFMEAMASHKIMIAYQKVYTAKDLQVYGREVLARWKNEDGYYIRPDVFIPILEKTELIQELFRFILQESINLIKNKSLKTKVSINLSPYNFRKENIDFMIEALYEAGISPTQIVLEITESEALNDRAIAYIHKLKKLGFAIAIDDFGTGYSSYYYLSILAVDYIKIDRSLIYDMDSNKKNYSLVESIVK